MRRRTIQSFLLPKGFRRIEIPLFGSLFGWQPRLVLVKIRKRLLWPFKKRWQYAALVCLLVVGAGTGVFLYRHHIVKAATYYFTQSSWEGGADIVNVPSHPDNQSGWTKYYSKDAGIDAGADVRLQMLPGEWAQGTDSEFAEGAFDSTAVRGEGESAMITLD